MTDRAQVLGAILDDNGKLSALQLEQEDHTTKQLSLAPQNVRVRVGISHPLDFSNPVTSIVCTPGKLVRATFQTPPMAFGAGLGLQAFMYEDNDQEDWSGLIAVNYLILMLSNMAGTQWNEFASNQAPFNSATLATGIDTVPLGSSNANLGTDITKTGAGSVKTTAGGVMMATVHVGLIWTP
jgi:hypothetical protein